MHQLFSYGTLQLSHVQMAIFGRPLSGLPDILLGYVESTLVIQDASVIQTSGRREHLAIRYTGNRADRVPGVVFEISALELARSDEYESGAYVRVEATLESGCTAWVYVDAQHAGEPDT